MRPLRDPPDARVADGQRPGGGELKWSVTVENGGDFDETNIVVNATFSYPDTPNDVRHEAGLHQDVAGDGDRTTVEIPGPAPTAGLRRAGDAPHRDRAGLGREQHDNNRAEYPVKITI